MEFQQRKPATLTLQTHLYPHDILSAFPASKKIQQVHESKPLQKKRKKIQKHKTVSRNHDHKQISSEQEQTDDYAHVFEGLFKGEISFGSLADKIDKFLISEATQTILNAYKNSQQQSIQQHKKFFNNLLKQYTSTTNQIKLDKDILNKVFKKFKEIIGRNEQVFLFFRFLSMSNQSLNDQDILKKAGWLDQIFFKSVKIDHTPLLNFVGVIQEFLYDSIELDAQIQNKIKYIVDRIANKKKSKKKRKRLEELSKQIQYPQQTQYNQLFDYIESLQNVEQYEINLSASFLNQRINF